MTSTTSSVSIQLVAMDVFVSTGASGPITAGDTGIPWSGAAAVLVVSAVPLGRSIEVDVVTVAVRMPPQPQQPRQRQKQTASPYLNRTPGHPSRHSGIHRMAGRGRPCCASTSIADPIVDSFAEQVSVTHLPWLNAIARDAPGVIEIHVS